MIYLLCESGGYLDHVMAMRKDTADLWLRRLAADLAVRREETVTLCGVPIGRTLRTRYNEDFIRQRYGRATCPLCIDLYVERARARRA